MNRTSLLALTASLLAGTTAVANPNCPGCAPVGAAVTNLLKVAPNFPKSGYNPFVTGKTFSGSFALAQQFTTAATTFHKIYAGLWNISGPNTDTYLSIFNDNSGLPGSVVRGCQARLVNGNGVVAAVNTLGAYAQAACMPNTSVPAGTYWVVVSTSKAAPITTDEWLYNVGDMATLPTFAKGSSFNSGYGGTTWSPATLAYGAESYAVK